MFCLNSLIFWQFKSKDYLISQVTFTSLFLINIPCYLISSSRNQDTNDQKMKLQSYWIVLAWLTRPVSNSRSLSLKCFSWLNLETSKVILLSRSCKFSYKTCHCKLKKKKLRNPIGTWPYFKPKYFKEHQTFVILKVTNWSRFRSPKAKASRNVWSTLQTTPQSKHLTHKQTKT